MRFISRFECKNQIFASLGNHDYYDNPKTTEEYLKKSNKKMKVLRNETIKIENENLEFIGLEDFWSGKWKYHAETLLNVSTVFFFVCLCVIIGFCFCFLKIRNLAY